MDIPVKLLINSVLPFCEAKDVLSLGCTNKFFALIVNDDTFWRRRLTVDYNFTGLGMGRKSGWKFVYRKLRNPRVLVWGCVTFSFFDVTRVFICSLPHSHAHLIIITQTQVPQPTFAATGPTDVRGDLLE